MSKNFTQSEFTFSKTAERKGISNVVPPNLETSAAFTLAGLERVRAFLGHPIQILSGYRCQELNAAVGGVSTPEKISQHCKAQAIDFVCPGYGTPKEVCIALAPKLAILGIDQLIWEGSWIHISFTLEPRCAALRLVDGRYLPGIA